MAQGQRGGRCLALDRLKQCRQLVLLAACGGTSEVPVTVPAGAQARGLTVEACTYEARDVEYAAECGPLIVPENRSDPGSRLDDSHFTPP